PCSDGRRHAYSNSTRGCLCGCSAAAGGRGCFAPQEEHTMRQSRSGVDSSRFSRRSVIKASAGLTGATALSIPLLGAAGAQGTPVASPAAPDGAIVSSVEGVPIAYTKYPDPYTTVDEVPGSGGEVSMLALSYS